MQKTSILVQKIRSLFQRGQWALRRYGPRVFLDKVRQRISARLSTIIKRHNFPARGGQTREAVEAINAHIVAALPIREIFTCYHNNKDDCPCRKPKPGLILQATDKYGLDLSSSWMVGDRWKDIAAGQAVGLKTIFVDYHYTETYEGTPTNFTVEDTVLLADIILKGQS